MSTNFRATILLPLLLALVSTILIFYYSFSPTPPFPKRVFIIAIIVAVGVIYFEIYKKVIRVYFHNDKIIVKRLFFLTHYYLKAEIKCIKVRTGYSRRGVENEYIEIKSNDNGRIILSNLYIKNYELIKKNLAQEYTLSKE